MPDASKTLEMSPLLHDKVAMKQFSYAFSQGANTLTDQDLKMIQVLSPSSCLFVWKSNRVSSAYHHSVNTIDTIGERKAIANVDRVVKKALHTDAMPRTFIRHFSQIDPHIYSLWKMQDRNWLQKPDELHNSRISEEAFREFWHQYTFVNIKRWLTTLPFNPDERVYVAKSVDCTLVIEWKMFKEHWDSFCSSYNTLNVINDDPRWFIHFHQEDVIAFGCTSEFADEKNLDANNFEQEFAALNDTLQHTAFFERSDRKNMSVGLFNQFVSERQG